MDNYNDYRLTIFRSAINDKAQTNNRKEIFSWRVINQ